MKIVGIQLKSTEAILVVLEKNADGNVVQLAQSTKFKFDDPNDHVQVRQFRDQVNTAFDTISPDQIGILARNYKAKGMQAPSPMSFKLEGIIQLNEKYPITFVWPQSISAHFKKNPLTQSANKKFEEGAFNVAYYLMVK